MKKLSDMTLEELWELFPIFLTKPQSCWAEWYEEEKKEKSVNISIVLLVMLLALALLAVLYLLVLRPMTMGADVGEYINEIFGIASDNISV